MEKLWFVIRVRVKKKGNSNSANGKWICIVGKLIKTIFGTRELVESIASLSNE